MSVSFKIILLYYFNHIKWIDRPLKSKMITDQPTGVKLEAVQVLKLSCMWQ